MGLGLDSAAGVRAVAAKQGAYDDAIRTKRNTLILTLMNLFGGMAPGAVKRLRELAARSAKGCLVRCRS